MSLLAVTVVVGAVATLRQICEPGLTHNIGDLHQSILSSD